MYPALSSYLTRTSDLRPRKAFGASRPADGPTYAAPPSGAPTPDRAPGRAPDREGKGRHRAAASTHRQPRLRALPRHGAIRRRRGIPPLSYGYASAALLVLTAALVAQPHEPAPGSPHAAPPAEQPDAPRHVSPPAPDKEPSAPAPPSKPGPHPRSPASADAPPARSAPAANSAPSVLRLGSTGSSVRQLQEQLGQLRLYTGPVDGYYSHDVAAAVARMQQARAIPEPLGVYGPGTRTAITTAAM
ncbi:peptidoglycan-binding protein [Streptomyces sp. NPDC058471]|uniref:peptidoglycan-binding domain-containing protein n=1 Tax=Streptomyces sp. NPDC058471 TaxID=3346516 RepID=UPI00364C68FE